MKTLADFDYNGETAIAALLESSEYPQFTGSMYTASTMILQ
jgi:hypothetical protein